MEEMGSRMLTYHPLDPDDIVGVGLWAEVLETTAEVVPHPLALLTQVSLRFNQKVFCHIHHVHHSEEWQEQPLGDPSDAGATVQGAGGARLVWAFLKCRAGGGALRGVRKPEEPCHCRGAVPHKPGDYPKLNGTGW